MAQLNGKTAIVTGASAPKGIGRAIAMRLAQDGANIVVGDIDGTLDIGPECRSRRDLLEELATEIRAGGNQALALILDVTSQDDVDDCVARAVSEFGRIDIVVNNAGSLAGSDNFMSTTGLR